jgi:GH15 family glucan-1,4-alpha-glucosidase
MPYQPIENYGVIGNMHTAALVGMDGSIDWFCHPHFDSPAVFAAILDEKKGGRFQITSRGDNVVRRQSYWPDSNILITRFYTADGVGQLVDYMPVDTGPDAAGGGHSIASHSVVRRVGVARGSMRFRLVCRPAFDYARGEHETRPIDGGALFHSPTSTLGLITETPLRVEDDGVTAEFALDEDQSAIFVLQPVDPDCPSCTALGWKEEARLFESTVAYWRRWLSGSSYTGRWREMVHRSALALKLLTYAPTGAIVASPTCSLPEDLGGERNWDYRYTWIRDAAFTLYALLRIGFTQEAAEFMQWLEARVHELGEDGSLQIMYGIDGRHELTETTLDHLEGYRGSRPVRVGNGAHRQLQLDIYGELMDSIYLYNKYGNPISYDLWIGLRRLVNWVCDHWQQQDEGIWEVRSGRQHFVYSKLMCWVAVDRGLRLADKRSFPADRERWIRTRDRIYEEIMARGWNRQRQAFVQYYGSDSLDAANLIMPLVFFLSPSDPRMLQTLDTINRSPAKGGLVSNSLVYRYDVSRSEDGIRGDEGTFNMCTFWLVEALTRAGRHEPERLDQARFIFNQMLAYANHLGLYGEETGPHGEALGNFPQAFTHVSLISAAFNLDRALGSRD